MKNFLVILIATLLMMPLLTHAQVGVGSLTPTSMLHAADTVIGTASWEGSFVDIQNVSSILNTTAGIRFKVDDNVINQKYRAGIFFKRNTVDANGSLIFSNSESTATGNVTSTTNARMTITAAGLVGIGTTDPDHKLSVVSSDATTDGSSGVFMDIQNSYSSYGVISGIRFRNGTTDETFKGGIFYQDKLGYGRGDLIFVNNSTNSSGNVTLNDARMTIKNNGNIGIGTTDPQKLFHVYESEGGLDVKFESDNGNPKIYMDGTTGSSGIFFENSGIAKANIGYNLATDNLYFTHGQTIAIKNGFLGIGVLAPQYPIHVKAIGVDCEVLLESTSERSLLRMDGEAGLGEIRFQTNGTYKGAFGYNYDNDNLYLYHNGNLKFSNGDLYVTDDYNYISNKTYTIQYPACAFQLDSYGEYEENVIWSQSGYAKIKLGVTQHYADMFCPVNVPNGAEITSISQICYVELDYLINFCTIDLYRRSLTASNSEQMANIYVGFSNMGIQIDTSSTISFNIIDNSNYQYYMKCSIADETTKFYGAFLTYSISKISQ